MRIIVVRYITRDYIAETACASLDLISQTAQCLVYGLNKRVPIESSLIECHLQMLARRAGWPFRYERYRKPLRASLPPYEPTSVTHYPKLAEFDQYLKRVRYPKRVQFAPILVVRIKSTQAPLLTDSTTRF